jgi:hypothetical protein
MPCLETDAARKAPNARNAKVGAKLQILMVPSFIASVSAFGYAVDGFPATDRAMKIAIAVMFVGGIGMLAGFVGLIRLCIALVKDHYRAPWLFWLLVGYGPFLLSLFPWGTAFGIFFIVYALIRRREFFQGVASFTTPV